MSKTRPISSLLATVRTFIPDDNRESTPPFTQKYLTGLRGVLAIESFLWLFWQTFVPSLAYNEVDGPLYQTVLRKIFSVLFWDRSLLCSFFVILSARTCCVHFLQDPSAMVFARSLITRPLRIGVSISIALAIAIAIFAKIDTSYISVAASLIKNPTLEAPSKPATSLARFNSIYDLLWVVRDFGNQEGNQAWPSKTMWIPSLIYFQSYTVYIAMVILPFTRSSWHWAGLLLFSLGSFWFNSWGWYSAAGLFIADLSLDPLLRTYLISNRKSSDGFSIPCWIWASMTIILGLILEYVWVAAVPQYTNDILVLHPGMDGLSSDINRSTFDTAYSYPRLDNYLVVVGFLVLLETSEFLKKVLSTKALVYLGKRSLCESDSLALSRSALTCRSLAFFVAQSLLVYTIGLMLYVALRSQDISSAGANAVVFIVIVPSILCFGEIFYRVVDKPAEWLGRGIFHWTRN